MIAIVSSSARERAAFAALCLSRGWITLELDSLRALRRALRRNRPHVVLARQQVSDGYSDDLIAALREAQLLPQTKLVVLLSAGASSTVEARQVSLGADCVQRDPVRTNVLIEYLAKYCNVSTVARASGSAPKAKTIPFAGAYLQLVERALARGPRTAALTPREVELVELLSQADGEVITYETLYHEILGRPYRGDTSNMRVLLGKLTASAATLGIPLRRWVEVIPKMGYLYRSSGIHAVRPARARAKFLSAA